MAQSIKPLPWPISQSLRLAWSNAGPGPSGPWSPAATCNAWPAAAARLILAATAALPDTSHPSWTRYRSTSGHRRFTTRDRTGRHPGCHNRAAWASLDHVLPHAHSGATDCTNLCCLRRHHRRTTHPPSWSVATDDKRRPHPHRHHPTGVTRVTRPPWASPSGSMRALPAPPTEPAPIDDPPPV